MDFDYKSVKEWLESHVHQSITERSNAEDFKLMTNILKCHPDYDKWTYKIPEIFTITRSSQKKNLQVYVKFVGFDNKRLVSWVSCANRKIKKKDPLTQAMRTAITPQIQAFRTKHPVQECEICKVCRKIEVDHYPKTFANIKKTFLECDTNAKLPSKFIWIKSAYYFHPNDTTFAQKWETYHKDRATYRYLCDKCNQTNK